MNQIRWFKHRAWDLWTLLGVFSALETKSLLFLADIWSSQLIVNTISSRTKAEKMAGSLREDTFLEKSLPIVILGTVGILESKPMFSSSLSSSKDTAIALGEIFLEVEEAEILFEECLAM